MAARMAATSPPRQLNPRVTAQPSTGPADTPPIESRGNHDGARPAPTDSVCTTVHWINDQLGAGGAERGSEIQDAVTGGHRDAGLDLPVFGAVLGAVAQVTHPALG
ncbi:hypothetical protein GCM10023321_58810 [Pseudonocardia eucalypti]|uniref:Uncharacterized protein n=1 Tax=Pseudonocardia eucalypti TaxID=648755 RepID=A0ABP9QT98_9PSEU